MVVSGFSELLTILCVTPFVSLLMQDGLSIQSENANFIFNFIKNYFPNKELLFVSFTFIFIITTSASLRLLTLRLNGIIAAGVGSDLSKKAFRRIIYQPYEFHTNNNSSKLIASIISHITDTVIAINALLQLLTSLVVTIGILIGLFLIDIKISVFSIFIFSIIYVFISSNTKITLSNNSTFIAKSRERQIRILQESIGGIRDLIISGNYQTFQESYENIDIPMRIKQAQNAFLSYFPRFAIEAFGLLLLIIMGLIIENDTSSKISVIPLLGAFALGAQRLLPAFQQVYSSWANIKSLSAGMQGILNIFKLPDYFIKKESLQNLIPFKKEIKFSNLNFGYKNSKTIFRNVNLKIYKGEKIGIIGSTGAGKSTFIDILMGLISPQNGFISIDDKKLTKNLNTKTIYGWRSNISHVPQNIYLSDKSIFENIAFGIESKLIDHDRVKYCADLACISQFIENLPEKYSTLVGENGMRLSGGQRQRIGIARALYERSNILILDEATSALDSRTELKVMNSILNLSNNLTLFIVAHRLNTLKCTDRILKLPEFEFTNYSEVLN